MERAQLIVALHNGEDNNADNRDPDEGLLGAGHRAKFKRLRGLETSGMRLCEDAEPPNKPNSR